MLRLMWRININSRSRPTTQNNKSISPLRQRMLDDMQLRKLSLKTQGQFIDRERMLIRIEQGKGGKDRYAMLSPRLHALLRTW